MSGTPGAARPSSTPRGGWRGGAKVEQKSAAERIVGRVFFSLLCLALLGGFGWLLVMWLFFPTTHFAAFSVVHYGASVLPSLPFATEEVDAFYTVRPGGPAPDLGELEQFNAISGLDGHLQRIVAKPKDKLILYVAAHGVSDNGQAFIACSDFSPGQNVGRYPIGDFLDNIRKCRASLKLLILDAGQVSVDPRLGMVVNEFPRLLEEEVARINAPSLWVLTSHGPLESSHSLPGMKRTVFGYFVTEGLRGAADRDQDGAVDLAELAAFVQAGVSRWVSEENDVKDGQTPRLLHAGVGVDPYPPAIALVPVRKEKAAKKSEEEAEEKKNDNVDKDGKAGEEEPKAESTQPKPPDPSAQVRKRLEEAWTLCANLQARKSRSWLPVDYAPHLWREYEHLLMSYELRYRSGKAFDPNQLASSLANDILPLREFLENGKLPSGLNPESLLVRLQEARKQFLADPAAATYDKLPSELQGLGDAVRLRNDLVYRLPDYLGLHAVQSLAGRPTDRLRDAIDKMVSHLPKLTAALDFDAQSGREVSFADLDSRLKQAREHIAALESLGTSGIEAEAQEILKTPAKVRKPSRMEACLATPLLSGPLRMKLLDAMVGGDVPPPSFVAVEDFRPTLRIPVSRWRAIHEHARLEADVASLAKPDAGKPFSVPATIPEEEEAWIAYRELGGELADFYRKIPELINPALVAQARDRAALARMLRATDARDASRLDKEVATIALAQVPPPAPPLAMQLVGSARDLTISPDEWTPLEFALEAKGRPADETLVQLQYDPRAVEVAPADKETLIRPDEDTVVALDRQQSAKLSYRVRLKAIKNDAATELAPLVVNASRGAAAAGPWPVRLRRAAPDTVDLVVVGTKKGTVEDGGTPDTTRLRPFPNRTTGYRFDLINRSGRKRKVTVEFYGAGLSTTVRRTGRESPLDNLGNVNTVAGFQAWPPKDAKPIAIELSERPTAVPIPFPDFKPVAPQAKPAAKEEPGKPAEAAKPAGPPPLPIAGGLVCIIRDTESKKEWTKRIDLSPLAPRDYLDPIVSYSESQRRILVRMKPRMNDAGEPDRELLPDGEIGVLWETAGLLDPGTEMNDRAKLVYPGYEAEMFANVPPQTGKSVRVQLTVDGCPRALVYQVDCDHDRDQILPERSLRAIRITKPQANEAFQAPLPALEMELQVDAPENAFQNDRDVVQLIVDPDGTRRFEPPGPSRPRFYSDRQIEVTLQEASPDGQVKIKTDVHDFRTQLDPGGLRNAKVEIVARLVLASQAAQQRLDDKVPVILDGEPPQVRVVAPTTPVPQGVPVEVQATTNDLSGVIKVEIGLDLGNDGALAPPDKPVVLQQADGQQTRWKVSLATDQVQPGQYRVIVLATDGAQRTSKNDVSKVTIVLPAAAAAGAGAMKPKPASNNVLGRVHFVDQACVDFKVELRSGEAVIKRTTTDEKGEFRFTDLEAGGYKIQVDGAHRNRFRKGATSVTLPAATDPAEVNIEVE